MYTYSMNPKLGDESVAEMETLRERWNGYELAGVEPQLIIVNNTISADYMAYINTNRNFLLQLW